MHASGMASTRASSEPPGCPACGHDDRTGVPGRVHQSAKQYTRLSPSVTFVAVLDCLMGCPVLRVTGSCAYLRGSQECADCSNVSATSRCLPRLVRSLPIRLPSVHNGIVFVEAVGLPVTGVRPHDHVDCSRTSSSRAAAFEQEPLEDDDVVLCSAPVPLLPFCGDCCRCTAHLGRFGRALLALPGVRAPLASESRRPPGV